jgi:RHS repeat-associated protein
VFSQPDPVQRGSTSGGQQGSYRWRTLPALTLLTLLGLLLVFGLSTASGDESSEETAAAPAREVISEVVAKRTATSRTFKLSDGQLETRLFQGPVNYRNEADSWKPIEEELTELPSGALTNGDNAFDVHLPEDLNAAPVRVTRGEEWVSEMPVGVQTSVADLQQDGTASYAVAGGDAEFEFTGLANGLKESIELAGPDAPTTYRFQLDASAGVAPTLAEDGSIAFRGEDGHTVAEMPAPFMLDGAGLAAPAAAVRYSLEEDDIGSWSLVVIADAEWLHAPERSWPVIIDPSVTIPAPSLDCLIANTAEFNMCGSAGWPWLFGKANYVASGQDQFARSLLRFDLSSIPKTASLTSATIALYSSTAAKNVSQVDLYDVSRSWNVGASWRYWWGVHENPYKWAKEGGDYGQFLSLNPVTLTTAERGGSQAGWWAFSGPILTGLVQDWRTGEIANNGVLLKLHEETPRVCCLERSVQWDSSAGKEKPYLSVQYIPAASHDSVVTSPADGTKTAKRFLLGAAWDHSGVEGVTFQYQTGDNFEGWKNIPEAQVIDQANQTVGWPEPVSIDDRKSPPLYWDASGLTGKSSAKKVQIRAVLAGSPGAIGYTKPVQAEVNKDTGGAKDATAPAGPGTVDLLTGNFTVTRSDVSIAGFDSSLQFSRSISSRETAQSGVLGQGWQPASPVVEAGGSAWRSLRIESTTEEFEGESFTYKWAVLTHLDGHQLSFEIDEEGKFITPPEMSGNVLYRLSETQIAFTDPGGNRTVFANTASGNEYLPISVAQTGGLGNKTRMIYDVEGIKRRLNLVIAPTAPGITCSDEKEKAITTPGCRVLGFSYDNAKKWGAPEGEGLRLSKITFYAPGNGGPWDVANYSYDPSGRLAAVWDPRISPELKETYTYESGGQLKTLKPAGQEGWTMGYGTIAGDTAAGRLVSVKRPSLVAANPTAQLTIAYGVPVSGSGAPYGMSPQATSAWGQEDLPTDATAVFPPDEVPAAPPSSYGHATVYYMDAEGQAVNVATPQGAGSSGPSISTTETDVFGNVSRELTPENRLRALASGSGSAAKAKELDTQLKYSADGTLLLDERGPVHAVRLETGAEAGTVVQARGYRVIQYDKDAPEPKEGETWPLLPTSETTGALAGGKVLDQQTVEYRYDWPLREATETIRDPEGLKIKSISAYDPFTSLPIERRQPKDAISAGAGTTKIVYYKAGLGGSANCEVTIYAGLPCKVEPAAQPASGPKLPITRYVSYTALGRPTEVIEETTGSTPGTRTTTNSYDSAGRLTSKQIAGGGTQIPKVETIYDATKGLPTTRRFVCPISEPLCDKETITATYDALGRVTAYQDADGNEAKTTYDINGRLATVNDGKGTQTFGYDPASGMLVTLADSMAGTFTASYDADGRMIKRGLPNGLTAETVFNAGGAPTDLTYTKASNCGTSCTWLDSEVSRSISGRILTENGSLGTEKYSYDRVGRLTQTEETPAGSGCTTRSYAFDANSNRTSKTTRQPGVGGVCATSGGTTQTYGYDGADRLEGAGLVYDAFGRITTLPSGFAGGGNLVTSYFSNDKVATQSQGGVTNTFALDAELRQRQRTQGVGLEGVEVFHYADGSDSPAWTQLGGNWTRNITGIGGELVAVAKSGSPTRLQLSNLHGDIVATASTNPSDTQLSLTARTDEFGNPLSGTPDRFGWMGGAQRRTEFPSGVIQMGARSYVPAIGRFLSTDPIAGGSANAYDYANADPVNQFDPSGMKPHANGCDSGAVGCQVWLHLRMWSPRGGRMGVRMIIRTNRAGGIRRISFDINYWVDEKDDIYKEGFVEMAPPHYLNSYPGVPSSCRTSDPCAANHDAQGTFACRPGNEYQIKITFKYRYNVGAGVQDAQVLEAEAQEFCRY